MTSASQTNEVRKRTIRTAVVLTPSAVVSILLLMFAFIQKSAADKARMEATPQRLEAEQQMKLRVSLEKQLQECQSGK
jgi:hypothetical protein